MVEIKKTPGASRAVKEDIMAVKECPVCGAKEKCKIQVVDGYICARCTWLSPNYMAETIATLKGYWSEQNSRKAAFTKTRVIKSLMSDAIIVDDNNRLFYVGKEKDAPTVIYSFDEVTGCGFENEVQTITKKKGGLGRAVVGGALFGGVGAIVGASTAKEVTTQKSGPGHLNVWLNTSAGERTLILYSPPIGADQFFQVCARSHEQ